MTNTVTETETAITATRLLDTFRETFQDKDWCDGAEQALERHLRLVTYTLKNEPCECGNPHCGMGGQTLVRTEPRWSYVYGPQVFRLNEIRDTLLQALAEGDLTPNDALKLAENLGIKNLYPAPQSWTVTLTVHSGPGEHVGWGKSGPDDFQIRNAIRCGRYTDKTMTKVS